MARKQPGKPRLPRFRMPPPEKLHRDEKKAGSRAACRRFRTHRPAEQ